MERDSYRQSFKAHPWLLGGPLQTIGAQFLGEDFRRHLLVSQALILTLPDGDKLKLIVNPPDGPVRGTVVLFHGLGGDSNSLYNRRLAAKLTRRGWRVVRFNHRGCGPEAAHLARQIYHAGTAADLRASLHLVGQEYPGAIFAIGFSLSGNALLNCLADGDLPANMRAGMAVCPAIDLEACSLSVSRVRNLYIDQYFALRMRQLARVRRRHFPDLAHPRLPWVFSLRTFDEVYTSRLAGFQSRADYYHRSSARSRLAAIKLSTTILASADDPVVPVASFQNLLVAKSVQLHIERTGGHMGFISAERTRDGDFFWMDQAIDEWLEREITA